MKVVYRFQFYPGGYRRQRNLLIPAMRDRISCNFSIVIGRKGKHTCEADKVHEQIEYYLIGRSNLINKKVIVTRTELLLLAFSTLSTFMDKIFLLKSDNIFFGIPDKKIETYVFTYIFNVRILQASRDSYKY